MHEDEDYESFMSPALFVSNELYDHFLFDYGDKRIRLKCMGRHLQHTQLTAHILWPAADLMCHFINSYKHIFNNKSVLELGCGVGLCGLLVSKYNSGRKVVLTDCADEIMDLIQYNIDLNEAYESSSSSSSSNCNNKGNEPQQRQQRITLDKLYWGEQLEQFKQKHGAFDMIIGSDLLYERDCVVPLFQTAYALLKDDDGDDGNSGKDDGFNRPCFIQSFKLRSFVSRKDIDEAAIQSGFEIEEIPLSSLLPSTDAYTSSSNSNTDASNNNGDETTTTTTTRTTMTTTTSVVEGDIEYKPMITFEHTISHICVYRKKRKTTTNTTYQQQQQ